MDRCGSNKAERTEHPYTLFYDSLFGAEDMRRILEIGIGSQNPAMPYSMGAHRTVGGSLRGWRDYFPNAVVHGADYDRDTLFREERIETFWFDQYDVESIRRLLAFSHSLVGEGPVFDLILDDAVHEVTANALFFREAIGSVRDGGWFVIEDLNRNPGWIDNHVALAQSQPYPAIIVNFNRSPADGVHACFMAVKKVAP